MKHYEIKTEAFGRPQYPFSVSIDETKNTLDYVLGLNLSAYERVVSVREFEVDKNGYELVKA